MKFSEFYRLNESLDKNKIQKWIVAAVEEDPEWFEDRAHDNTDMDNPPFVSVNHIDVKGEKILIDLEFEWDDFEGDTHNMSLEFVVAVPDEATLASEDKFKKYFKNNVQTK
jgi:hypothetical protein